MYYDTRQITFFSLVILECYEKEFFIVVFCFSFGLKQIFIVCLLFFVCLHCATNYHPCLYIAHMMTITRNRCGWTADKFHTFKKFSFTHLIFFLYFDCYAVMQLKFIMPFRLYLMIFEWKIHSFVSKKTIQWIHKTQKKLGNIWLAIAEIPTFSGYFHVTI